MKSLYYYQPSHNRIAKIPTAIFIRYRNNATPCTEGYMEQGNLKMSPLSHS